MVLKVVSESGALYKGVLLFTPREIRIELGKGAEQIVSSRKLLWSVLGEESLSDIRNVKVTVD